MKKNLTFFLTLTVFCTLPIILNAQIRYFNGNLNINNAPQNFSWGLYINKWPSLYWTCNDNNFFLLDVSPANPRISGTGNQVVFYNTITGAYNSIQVANVYNYSDAKAKDNVQTLTTGLNTILRLRPVTYNWKHNNMLNIDVTEKSDSTENSISTGPIEDGHTQYGFLAQEVEDIIPDAVKTDESGNKLVNYTALIPMLVKAIQELQLTVEEQAQKIEQLTGMSTKFMNSKTSTNKIISCSPNPTDGYITISTKLDSDVKIAKIAITSLSGTREKTLTVTSDSPTISENISSFDSGIYVVSLYVNNILCNSVRFIKE